MRIRKTILTIAAAVAIAVPLTVAAQGPPGGGSGGGNGGGWGHGGNGGGWGHGSGGDHGLAIFDRLLPRIADEIGLTDEQMAEIQALVDDARPTIEGLASDLRDLQQDRRENHDPAVFDEGEIRAFAQQKFEIQLDLMIATEKTRAAALQVLTEEQRQQLAEMRGSHGRQHKRRPGGRRTQ